MNADRHSPKMSEERRVFSAADIQESLTMMKNLNTTITRDSRSAPHSKNACVRRLKKCFLSNHSGSRKKPTAFLVMLLCLFFTIFPSSCIARVDNNNKNIAAAELKVHQVYAVATGAAHLPCNIRPQDPRDGARLVLWYKDKSPHPVYSFDARFSTVKHWSEDPTFGPRTYFRDSSEPAQLIISDVQMEDMGEYKCRVDFRDSPTVTTVILLNIVEEPKKPVILDDEGSAVMGAIGPYRLKSPLILVCIVEGGNPLPEVTWWKNGELYDRDGDPSTYEDVLQNTLVISALDRTFHDALFECRAINNNVTDPPR